jgi:hypothetical protein
VCLNIVYCVFTRISYAEILCHLLNTIGSVVTEYKSYVTGQFIFKKNNSICDW